MSADLRFTKDFFFSFRRLISELAERDSNENRPHGRK